ncbi:MAG TPA: DinB family protein [Kribbellaceae bacterium]
MTREVETLVAYLGSQRRHVLGILEGLDDEALRKPVLPSGWTCLGLVRHLTMDIERFWFRAVMAGEQDVIDELAELGDDAWKVGPEESAADVLAAYRRETELTDAVVGALPADAPPAWWPEEQFGGWRMDDLREVVLHVLVETACHAGHLDAARELVDGRQWRVLTG